MSKTKEEWRPILGFEGLYEISDWGNGRSLDRTIVQKGRWGKDVSVTYKGRILKPNKVGKGYRRFDLCKDGEYTHRYVHQLVLETFVGEIPEGLEIDHIIPISDGGGDELTNLRLVTREENMHNENTYKKYFIPCSDAKKESIRKTSKGKHYSPNTEFKKGCVSAFKGKHLTEKRKKEISENNSKQVYQYTLDNILVNCYDSCKDAAQINGFKICGISSCATGRLPHYRGFKWSYTRLGD